MNLAVLHRRRTTLSSESNTTTKGREGPTSKKGKEQHGSGFRNALINRTQEKKQAPLRTFSDSHPVTEEGL